VVTKICLVAGARPNFMKVAPLLKYLSHHSDVWPVLVHTGQHYDPEMSDFFFGDLGIPKADIYLGIGSGSHAEQTARTMIAFEDLLLREEPHVVIVVGDVNSTMACTLASAKTVYKCGRRPKVAHVEAGLRSFDRSMPEEINRIVTDALSDMLFTTSRGAVENLLREGVGEEKIFFVGNVMIDTLLAHRERSERSPILDRLGLGNGMPNLVQSYAVCTLHRPSNVDDEHTLLGILEALKEIGQEIPIIYPIHPRTRQRLEALNISGNVTLSSMMEPVSLRNPVTCIEPLGYLDFLKLMGNARLVLTDSGGIQEETTILGIPCVTIRENTERPITISQGTNILAGIRKEGIVRTAAQAINGSARKRQVPEKWDGKAAERIVSVLLGGNVDD